MLERKKSPLRLAVSNEMLGHILFGFAALAPNQKQIEVRFSEEMPGRYVVLGLELPYQTSWWITDKSKFGFKINVGLSCAGYHQQIGWSIGIGL